MQHEKTMGYSYELEEFSYWLTRSNHPYRLFVKESLIIQAYNPRLHPTAHLARLIIFLDDLPMSTSKLSNLNR